MQERIILFDGVCNFCNFWIRFVFKHDKNGNFKFAHLQSETAWSLMKKYELDASQLETVILIDGGQIFLHSNAALRICRYLNGAWPLIYALTIIPAPLRDAVYRLVSRKRYQWFGKSDQCLMPTPEMKSRFL
jgi:predicted DCC family thiol-disulfide oxidoreductase YuxK